MNEKLLRDSLIRHEGIVHKVYLDSLGYKTAGIGHLLPKNTQLAVGTLIPDEQVQHWFEEDILEALSTAKSVLGKEYFDELDDNRKAIVVNLAFNLGYKLRDFKNTLAALRAHDYELAAKRLENSKWYTQVGRRGPEICDALRNGYFSWQ